MTYDEFKKRVESAGLTARRCTDEHWQILGGVVPVNFYPSTSVYYIQGSKRGKSGTITQAIEAVLTGGMKCNPIGSAVKGKPKKIMLKKLEHFPICHWCHEPLAVSAATIDHVIPVSKGGPDNWINIVPACRGCNHKRGNSLLPPREDKPVGEVPQLVSVPSRAWLRTACDAVALVAATAAGFCLVWWLSK